MPSAIDPVGVCFRPLAAFCETFLLSPVLVCVRVCVRVFVNDVYLSHTHTLSLSLFLSLSTHSHTSIHEYVHWYARAYLPTYIRACIHTYIHACMHIRIYLYVHTVGIMHIQNTSKYTLLLRNLSSLASKFSSSSLAAA